MSKLDDLFGDQPKPKEKGNWKRVDIVAHCGLCFEEADEVYARSDLKAMKTVHYTDNEEHVLESEMDLTWLTNLLN